MASGFIVRLRPTGPWRLGPSSGARDRVDRVLHSDTLYSALTVAAVQIGILPDWLAATAEASEPVVRVASAFPFVGRTLLAPAPKHVWPPSFPGSGRTRWKAARFVPLQVVPRLLAYEALKEDRWAVDPVSEAVLPVEKFGDVTPPFRVAIRRTVPVDRLTGVSGEPASTACLEFADNAGMWCAVFCPPEWRGRVQSLFRFVADAGVGGERSLGWGRSAAPEFDDLPGALATEAAEPAEHHEAGYWTLSLFAPAPTDRVDWSRGSYGLVRRSGRTHDLGALKVESAMVEEGSVLMAESLPSGFARNVAPDDAPHPVYRAGFAFAVPVPVRLPGFHELERAATAESHVETAADVIVAEELTAEPAAELMDTAVPPSPTGADEVPFEDPNRAEAAPAPNITDAGGPAESTAEPIEDSVTSLESSPEPGYSIAPIDPAADEIPFEDSTAITDSAPAPEINDAGGPAESTAEPIEDALALPESVPEPERFTADTQPLGEQMPASDSADGGAFEDGPAINDADNDKPEDAQ